MIKYSWLDNNNVQIEVASLEQYIQEHDSDFKPPISSKTDIPKYALKLATLGKVIFCYDNEKIIGVTAFYCNSDEYAFCSYLSVDRNYRNKGIAKELINKMIDYCEKTNVLGIKTNTWTNNKAIELYLSNGFVQVISNNENRAELIYFFNRLQNN